MCLPVRSAAIPALLVAMAACAGDGAGTSDRSLRLEVVRAPAASSLPGAAFDSIVVRVVGLLGNPVAGVQVEWTGDGKVESLSTVSNDDGQVVAAWTLPRIDSELHPPWPTGLPGRYQLRAQVVDGAAELQLSTEARPFRADQVDADFAYACGVSGAALWCWGDQLHAVLPVTPSPEPQRIPLPGGIAVAEVRIGTFTLCVRSVVGAALCAGRGTGGLFVPVVNAPALVDLVSAGGDYCGRAQDFSAWCWPINGVGAFQAVQVFTEPLQRLVGGGTEYSTLVLGHACGLTATGAALCWGTNGSGQLGNGNTIGSATPVAVSGGLQFVEIAASFEGTCAVTADDGIWCWGRGLTPTAVSTPTRVLLPGISGTKVILGAREGYIPREGSFVSWAGTELLYVDPLLNLLDTAELSSAGQTCVRSTDNDVFCSWILLYGGGDTSVFPSGLVPVPHPTEAP